MKDIIINENSIKNNIYTIRKVQVILDEDLARLDHVETKQLNKSDKRNIS